jgi:hypothetical protein
MRREDLRQVAIVRCNFRKRWTGEFSLQMDKDETLIWRIRPLLARRKGFSEKRMLGGVCFMINGNMCVGTWKGSLVVRLDKADHDAIQTEPHTKPFDVTGRVMKGWALVEPTGIATDADLKDWVHRAAMFAGSLPPK